MRAIPLILLGLGWAAGASAADFQWSGDILDTATFQTTQLQFTDQEFEFKVAGFACKLAPVSTEKGPGSTSSTRDLRCTKGAISTGTITACVVQKSGAQDKSVTRWVAYDDRTGKFAAIVTIRCAGG